MSTPQEGEASRQDDAISDNLLPAIGMVQAAEAEAEEDPSVTEEFDQIDQTPTTASSVQQKRARTSRIRPSTSSSSRAKNPLKQAAGILGAEAKARKRDYDSTDLTDEGKQHSKKEKVDADTEVVDIPNAIMVPYDSTEFIDEAGRKFVIRHIRTNPTSRDLLWQKLARIADGLRLKVHQDTVNSSLTSEDLAMIKLEYVSHLVPSLVTTDGKLRLRKQQSHHRNVSSKATIPYLRKVGKAVEQTLFLIDEGAKRETLPPTTQTEIQTRLLKLPKSERSLTRQEHNDIIEGYEAYLGCVAEKVRLDLAFLHTTTEKFVEIAFKHEQRLGALCQYIQNATDNPCSTSQIPHLVIDYVKPNSHPCQCTDCMPDLTASLKQQLAEGMRDEIRESLRKEVIQTTTEKIRADCIEELSNHIRGREEERIRREIEHKQATEAKELAARHLEIDQLWDRYHEQQGSTLTDLYEGTFGPTVPVHDDEVKDEKVLLERFLATANNAIMETDCSPAHAEPTEEEKKFLDRLRTEAEAALHTQVIYDDEEEQAREDRLGQMRDTYQKMSLSLPRKPSPEEPANPEFTAKEKEVEKLHLAICAEVDAKWEKGYRKIIGDTERAVMEEWSSMLIKKHLGWTESNISEAEEERQLMADHRQYWLKKVYRQEDRNREAIERLLEAENSRRYDLARYPKAEVPRALIELSVIQMNKMGPEPPGAADEQMVSLLASTQQWRNRYLRSRASMEADPVAWMTTKRGPVGLSPAQFDEWAQQHGYYAWAQNVRENNLNAIDAFVTWEQTVGAAEVNRRFHAINASPADTGDDWTPTQAPPTDVTDISMEKAKTDNSIIQQASDLYNSILSNPTLTAAEVAVWKARFSEKAWWIKWKT